jgi:hypothetical protein
LLVYRSYHHRPLRQADDDCRAAAFVRMRSSASRSFRVKAGPKILRLEHPRISSLCSL